MATGRPSDASAALPDVATPAYQPKRQDWRYLQAVQELLAENGRITDYTLASKLGVSHTAVWKWRQRPGFEDWANDQLTRYVDRAKPKILTRAVELATRGSIDHMNFLAKVGGWFQQPEGANGSDVNVNVLLKV